MAIYRWALKQASADWGGPQWLTRLLVSESGGMFSADEFLKVGAFLVQMIGGQNIDEPSPFDGLTSAPHILEISKIGTDNLLVNYNIPKGGADGGNDDMLATQNDSLYGEYPESINRNSNNNLHCHIQPLHY